MRDRPPDGLEQKRVYSDVFGPGSGLEGHFRLQGPCGCELNAIAVLHEQAGWEQVSVTTDRQRSPNWQEMCFVKDLFWDEEECVMQLHPPISQYVKINRYCLHLWKPTHESIPQPPAEMVGVVGVGPDEGARMINDIKAYGMKDGLTKIYEIMQTENCAWGTAHQRWKASLT